MKSLTRESQIKELATMIRDTGNTCATHLYAIQDKNTHLILNYKNNMFYTTRRLAREARNSLIQNTSYTPQTIRIVKTDFVNIAPWKTAK